MFKYVCCFVLLAVVLGEPEPKASAFESSIVAHVDPAYDGPYSADLAAPYRIQSYGSTYHGAVNPYSAAYAYAPYSANPAAYYPQYRSAYGYNPIYKSAYGYNPNPYVY